MLCGAGYTVEECCLSAVRIAYQRHIDDMVFCMYYIFGFLAYFDGTLPSQTYHLLRIVYLHDLNHMGFRSAQAHLIIHYAVFYRVAQRRVQNHVHRTSLDKSHFHHTLSESAVAEYLHDHPGLAGLQFR